MAIGQARQRGNAQSPPPPPCLSKQRLCPSNTKRWLWFVVHLLSLILLAHSTPCHADTEVLSIHPAYFGIIGKVPRSVVTVVTPSMTVYCYTTTCHCRSLFCDGCHPSIMLSGVCSLLMRPHAICQKRAICVCKFRQQNANCALQHCLQRPFVKLLGANYMCLPVNKTCEYHF